MKNSKNIVIGAFLFIVLAMTVGYAAFASQLELNGTAEITGDWDVEIIGITPAAEGEGESTSATFTASTATFDAKLKKPGDTVTYTVTIQNKGNITATLDSAIYTVAENGSPAIDVTTTNPNKETLATGEIATATVTFTYKADTTSVPTVKTKSVTGIFNYVQAE